MMKKTLSVAALVSVAITGAAQAREQIRIAGSSTVFPFASKAAEVFGQTSGFKAPIYESTGTGGGMKRFCAADGEYDATGASRRMKKTELDICTANGVDAVEIQIGIDGLSIANSRYAAKYNLTREQVFLALAAQVPVNGKLVANPYKKWSEIDASLPDIDILVYGPPTTSGTRDAFIGLIMEKGAAAANVDKKLAKILREDGPFQEAAENDNLIVQKLSANPEALGIFGFSFLEENHDLLKGVDLEGVEPTFDNILAKTYPGWRPLFLYMKKAHVDQIPGLTEYFAHILSDKASGDEGYLVEKGLIPLTAEAKAAERHKLTELSVYSM